MLFNVTYIISICIHFCAGVKVVFTWQPYAVWQIFTSLLIFCWHFTRLKARKICCTKWKKLGKYLSYCTRHRKNLVHIAKENICNWIMWYECSTERIVLKIPYSNAGNISLICNKNMFCNENLSDKNESSHIF